MWREYAQILVNTRFYLSAHFVKTILVVVLTGLKAYEKRTGRLSELFQSLMEQKF